MHLALAIQQQEEDMTQDGDVQRFQVEKLKIEIYSTREAAGAAAAAGLFGWLHEKAKTGL